MWVGELSWGTGAKVPSVSFYYLLIGTGYHLCFHYQQDQRYLCVQQSEKCRRGKRGDRVRLDMGMDSKSAIKLFDPLMDWDNWDRIDTGGLVAEMSSEQ